MKKKLVIFDLDGTLLNTIKDLAVSTNYALAHYGYPTHTTDEYRFFVGNGINKLFERALPESFRSEENILKIRAQFLPYYSEHITDNTEPYPGIPELLETFQEENIKLAVASNKFQSGTSKLIATLFPQIHFTEIAGQRDNIPTKPDPTVVFNILKLANVTAKETLYVGDSGVDMQTAFNAGIESVGVLWGFRPKEELKQYHAVHLADKVEDLLKFI